MSRRPGTRVASDRSRPTLPTPADQSVDQSSGQPTASIPAGEAPGQQELKGAALSARVSTEKQEQEETIQSQLAALRQAAEQQGYLATCEDACIDDGYSGARLDRPALDRLRDLVAEGTYEAVLGAAPDRLARHDA
jgi:predicted site-specific integrase-resolvase